MPAPMACTVPGRTKNTSPGCAATRLSTSQIVPSFARRRSYKAILEMSKAMGIAPLDLEKTLD